MELYQASKPQPREPKIRNSRPNTVSGHVLLLAQEQVQLSQEQVELSQEQVKLSREQVKLSREQNSLFKDLASRMAAKKD